MAYANANAVPFVAIVGDSEMETGKVMLKNMITGEQRLMTIDEVVECLK